MDLGYFIKADKKAIFVEADYYVPFEPKKANIRIREKVINLQNDIKQSIKDLEIEEEEILFASYSENDKNRFYDVENMLFYNIGTSAFCDCCKNEIAFIGDEKRFATYDIQQTDIEEKYYYSYRVVKKSEIVDLLENKRKIAYWIKVPIDINVPQSASRYYATIRKNASNVVVHEVLKDKSLFGIRIELTLPLKSLPASVMKPLLDGIISAFHGEENKVKEIIYMMFGDIAPFINKETDKLNILGNREYVSQYRGQKSYKWNPEDERLQFAWITVNTGKEAYVSGEIYKW